MTTFDDAVVGAGILGLAHAYHLAKRGRKVIVFERKPQAIGASVRNFGMLWPIGQPAGAMLRMARRSLEHWETVLESSGLWHEHTGSLHLAYEDDEAAVLREFAEDAEVHGYSCRLMTPREVAMRAPAVRMNGLKAALWSSTEVCVDPRQIVAGLPDWLAQEYGVAFRFNCAVTACEGTRILAGGTNWRAERLWVCTGDDFQSLYPEVFLKSGLTLCKLQMMRTRPQDGWRLGPMLAAGLTLRHYKAFEHCPSLAAVKRRVQETMPDYDRYGIHVMASQNGAGEVVIGDSHEYGSTASPFDRAEIDELIVSYLRTFVDIPNPEIAQRWHGVYAKHPADPYFTAEPADGVTVVTGVGGAGMTLSFGLAEQIVAGILGVRP